MGDGETFRWWFVAIFVAAFSVSIHFRRRARRTSETIPRGREGKLVLVARMLVGLPLYVGMLAYMVRPALMEWAALPLPRWLRWAGVISGAAMVPALYWTLASLGKNVSETVLTKRDHELVTRGPYRWVRHPLYAAATIAFVSLGVAAANGFIVGMALAAFAGIAAFVVPEEEAELARKFGDEYRRYRGRTGRFAPRLRRRR